jgi:hypothetical protein
LFFACIKKIANKKCGQYGETDDSVPVKIHSMLILKRAAKIAGLKFVFSSFMPASVSVG